MLIIEYDFAKNSSNLEKHGVSFDIAFQLDWKTALYWIDLRKDYGEMRSCALALRDERLFFVAYVDRGRYRRVITLRKANKREWWFQVRSATRFKDW